MNAAKLPRDYAFDIRAAARAYLADRLERAKPTIQTDAWKRRRDLTADAARYVSTVYRDYAELVEVAELLEEDRVTAAAYAAARLNTIPREELPADAWRYLTDALATANA